MQTKKKPSINNQHVCFPMQSISSQSRSRSRRKNSANSLQRAANISINLLLALIITPSLINYCCNQQTATKAEATSIFNFNYETANESKQEVASELAYSSSSNVKTTNSDNDNENETTLSSSISELASKWPHLLLLSSSEISLVELPLINNGQISSIFKLSEFSAGSGSGLCNQALSAFDGTSERIDQNERVLSGPSLDGDLKNSIERTNDIASRASNGTLNLPTTITTTPPSASLTSNSGQDEQQMRKKRSATSLGKHLSQDNTLRRRWGQEQEGEREVEEIGRRWFRKKTNSNDDGDEHPEEPAAVADATVFLGIRGDVSLHRETRAKRVTRPPLTRRAAAMSPAELASGLNAQSTQSTTSEESTEARNKGDDHDDDDGNQDENQSDDENDATTNQENVTSGSLLTECPTTTLKDFDVHMQQGLIFVLDGRGQIHKIHLFDSTSSGQPSRVLKEESKLNGNDASGHETDANPGGSSKSSLHAYGINSNELNDNNHGSSSNNNQIPSSITTPAATSGNRTEPETTDPTNNNNNIQQQQATATNGQSSSSSLEFGQHPNNAELQREQLQTPTATSGPSSKQQQSGLKQTIIWSARRKLSDRTRSKYSRAWQPNSKQSEQQLQQLAGDAKSANRQNNTNYSPIQPSGSIAVDWLNDVLYVLDKNRLFCLDFEGRREILLIDDFLSSQSPINLRLDPVNNFLFWLQPGRFHASIYRLDLNVLTNEQTLERMRSNLNKSSTSALQSPPIASSLHHKAKQQAKQQRQPFAVEALISRHYAHPIVTNLPKQTKLFLIDHKNSRIYVPITQHQQQQTKAPPELVAGGKEFDLENLVADSVVQQATGDNQQLSLLDDQNNTSTQTNQTCEHQSQTPSLLANNNQQVQQQQQTNVNANKLQIGQILTFNLDSSDAGPLRSGPERDHWSSDQPSGDMRDLALDSSRNLLYWLTQEGREIFEEYLDDEGKLHPAQHRLDGDHSYNKLIYFSPLANQTNQPATTDGHSNAKSPIADLMRMIFEHQQKHHHQYKKSIGAILQEDGIAANSIMADFIHGDSSADNLNAGSGRYFSPTSTPWFLLIGTGLILVLVFILYGLIFDQRSPITSAFVIQHPSTSSSSAASSNDAGCESSSISSRLGQVANSILGGASTLTRWQGSKGGASTTTGNHRNSTTEHQTPTNINRLTAHYDFDSIAGGCGYSTSASSAHNGTINTQAIICNEHYRNQQPQQQYDNLNSENQQLPNLSAWPSSVPYLANDLYTPIEIMDEELASIRRISIDRLLIYDKPLGTGHFGTVHQGVIRNCSLNERDELLSSSGGLMVAPQSRGGCSSVLGGYQSGATSSHDYENELRYDAFSFSHDTERRQAASLAASGSACSGGGSSGHGSTSNNSDVFTTAQLASLGANTGDYLTPRSHCGPITTISDYEDNNQNDQAGLVSPSSATSATGITAIDQSFEQQIQNSMQQTSTSLQKPFRVAIKKLKENATSKQDFLQEAKILAKFNHPNIVKLLGICLNRGSTLIVMELMLGSDLTRYMTDAEIARQLDEDDLLTICLDIVAGCCYLDEMKHVHRDLAARNCLVSSRRKEERVVKLADFGLARDMHQSTYYKQMSKPSDMPYKWMALECMEEKQPKFTSQSDVWSFGVVLWEVCQYCQERPYESVDAWDLKRFLEKDNRLERPKRFCDEDLYKLMRRCWDKEPDQRPTFQECQVELIEIRNKLKQTRQGQHQASFDRSQMQIKKTDILWIDNNLNEQDQQTISGPYYREQCEV